LNCFCHFTHIPSTALATFWFEAHVGAVPLLLFRRISELASQVAAVRADCPCVVPQQQRSGKMDAAFLRVIWRMLLARTNRPRCDRACLPFLSAYCPNVPTPGAN